MLWRDFTEVAQSLMQESAIKNVLRCAYQTQKRRPDQR
jgi:hypothetical protein